MVLKQFWIAACISEGHIEQVVLMLGVVGRVDDLFRKQARVDGQCK